MYVSLRTADVTHIDDNESKCCARGELDREIREITYIGYSHANVDRTQGESGSSFWGIYIMDLGWVAKLPVSCSLRQRILDGTCKKVQVFQVRIGIQKVLVDIGYLIDVYI